MKAGDNVKVTTTGLIISGPNEGAYRVELDYTDIVVVMMEDELELIEPEEPRPIESDDESYAAVLDQRAADARRLK